MSERYKNDMIFSLLLLYKKRKERHLYVLEPDSCSILMNSKMIKTKGSCSWSQNYKLDDRMYVDVDRRCIAGFYIYNAFQNAIIPHTKSGPILFSTEQLSSFDDSVKSLLGGFCSFEQRSVMFVFWDHRRKPSSSHVALLLLSICQYVLVFYICNVSD